VTGVVWSVYPSAPHRLTETQRRADNMNDVDAAAALAVAQLSPASLARFEAWIDDALNDNIVLGND